MSGIEDLQAIVGDEKFRFPLIIKPCSSANSEGVSKVNNVQDLCEAMKAVDSNRRGRDVVIENYCDGPEVDANFILEDGKIMFFEVTDEYPKDADYGVSGVANNF